MTASVESARMVTMVSLLTTCWGVMGVGVTWVVAAMTQDRAPGVTRIAGSVSVGMAWWVTTATPCRISTSYPGYISTSLR